MTEEGIEPPRVDYDSIVLPLNYSAENIFKMVFLLKNIGKAPSRTRILGAWTPYVSIAPLCHNDV